MISNLTLTRNYLCLIEIFDTIAKRRIVDLTTHGSFGFIQCCLTIYFNCLQWLTPFENINTNLCKWHYNASLTSLMAIGLIIFSLTSGELSVHLLSCDIKKTVVIYWNNPAWGKHNVFETNVRYHCMFDFH